jgi:pimeloyl-ACP methyl ester carboxylesterase
MVAVINSLSCGLSLLLAVRVTYAHLLSLVLQASLTTLPALCPLLQTMMRDIVEIWKALFGSSSSSSDSERVPTLLVGHSMGGALAVWAAATKEIAGLDGVVVIDVVEGTALGGWLLCDCSFSCGACFS